MGSIRSESNWSDAFTIPLPWPSSRLSSPKWEETMVVASLATSSSRTERASAAPSAGSVPVPISSISTSDFEPASVTMVERFPR